MSNRTAVIAEIGLNHNGDYKLAQELVRAASKAGADVAKFQKRDVSSLAIKNVLNHRDDRFPSMGSTYREIRESHEFDFEEFTNIKSEVEAKNMEFLCTPFDHESVDFLEDLGVEAYKIASHSVTNLPLLRKIANTGKPVFMSSGMCTRSELNEAIGLLHQAGNELTLFHCISAYPQDVKDSNIRMINKLKQDYELPIGYSGHELGYAPTIAAVARGAVAVERHFTLDKSMEGFDHAISLEPPEFTEMVKMIRQVNKSLGDGEFRVLASEHEERKKYHVSMVAAERIPHGAILNEHMVTYKNPGTGIPPKLADTVLGKRTTEPIQKDTLIHQEMLEE
jgi:sialic acid synthase SpsE